jgi:hypothetical protein
VFAQSQGVGTEHRAKSADLMILPPEILKLLGQPGCSLLGPIDPRGLMRWSQHKGNRAPRTVAVIIQNAVRRLLCLLASHAAPTLAPFGCASIERDVAFPLC